MHRETTKKNLGRLKTGQAAAFWMVCSCEQNTLRVWLDGSCSSPARWAMTKGWATSHMKHLFIFSLLVQVRLGFIYLFIYSLFFKIHCTFINRTSNVPE